MKLILLISILLGPLFPASAQHSQLKGWVATTRELSTRLAPRGQQLPMWEFLPAYGLEELLGTWINTDSEHTFRNGTPNPVNMLIWNATLSQFAKAVGNSCKSTQFSFNPQFLRVFNRICTWPAADGKSDLAMMDFWLALMGYNAPESEFLTWKEFFLNSSYAQKPAEESVRAMTFAIVMNPYFLLNR